MSSWSSPVRGVCCETSWVQGNWNQAGLAVSALGRALQNLISSNKPSCIKQKIQNYSMIFCYQLLTCWSRLELVKPKLLRVSDVSVSVQNKSVLAVHSFCPISSHGKCTISLCELLVYSPGLAFCDCLLNIAPPCRRELLSAFDLYEVYEDMRF